MTLAFWGGAFCQTMETSLLGLLLWCFHLEQLWAAGIFQHQRAAPPKARTPKTKEWMPSSSASLASPFTWVPTPNMDKSDPEGSEAAVAFLYSGDTSRLLQANCTQRFEVRELGKASSPPPALHSSLRSAIETLAHATNFLNMVFQTNDIRESSVKEDVEWYHALVRSVMEGDSQVYRAILTFDAHPVSSKPQLMLQATKENNEILLQDLSVYAENLRNLTWENEWYNFFRFQKAPTLFKRILSNDLKTLDTPKWSRGDSYVMDTDHIKWSPPFLECEDGKFLSNWMVTLSSSFYGLKPDLKPEFKGVLRMDIKIRNIDINQCASGRGWFANTHQCDLNSTQCVPQENQGFILGRYLCPCKPGFYRPSRPFSSSSSSSSSNGWSGKSSSQYVGQYGTVDSGNLLECRPCQEGCTTCIDDMPCLIKEDWSLRAAILAFQAFCMLAVFLSMLISYHFRKSKRIRASGVILLETILFGSLLLYFPVFILYFKPSIFRCIVLRWVRMLGFAIVYGTITLKLYRVLKVFLSRTAQRVPYMTSGRVLKMLALILLLVLWFLAAWTVGMLENIEKNIPLVVRSQTTNGLQFYICDHDRWDYMMVVAEMLFLFWGSFLCYATRTVPSAFHEPRYMGIALHNELIISATFHVVRFLMVPSLHPDWTLLLFFIHTHITTTLTLALLFIPKFLHVGSPLREEIAAEVYEDELDMRRSGSYLNSSITSAWSEHSLDPDDIRDELKKLYTQLEVHKTKKMTANNPHLQKKRSSKRGIGRSLMRRITEIPESMSRQCSKEEKDAGRGGGSRSGSYKRRHLDSGSLSMKLKDDFSSKRKVAPSLKKSHSTYDHMRDVKENSLPVRHDSCKEAPLLDSMMRKKLAKKASERSNSDSLDDSAPLVYKSASAHNLSADKKPLHPKLSPLQKSLSVATSAKEKALFFTSRAYLEERGRQTQEKETEAEDSAMESKTTDVASNLVMKQQQRGDASEATADSLLEDSSSIKYVAWPTEAVSASTIAPSMPSESRIQKHVTYAPNRSYSMHISDSVGKRHLAGKKTPPEPPVRQQSLGLSLERRDQTPALTQSLKEDSKGSPTLINVHPWESMESPAKSETESSWKAAEDAPLPSPIGLQRLASIAAEVCPWEVMEVPSKKDPQGSEMESQGDSPEKQAHQTPMPKTSMKSISLAIKAFNRSRIKASMKARRDSEESQRTNEKPKLAEIASLSVGGSPRQQETSRSPDESRAKVPSRQASICPWDEEDISLSPQKSPSISFDVCPWEMSQDSIMLGGASGSEAMAPKSTGKISPVIVEETKSEWESMPGSMDMDPNAEVKTSKYALMVPRTDNKKAAAYPWEVAEAKSDGQYSEMSTALPRDEPITDECKKGASLKEDLQSVTQEKVSSQLDLRDIKEMKKSPELSEVDQKKPKSMEINKTQICPWETEEVSTSDKALICPWDVEEPPMEMSPVKDKDMFSKEYSRTQRAVEMEKISPQVDSICPWESMELPAKNEDAESADTCKTPEGGTNIRIVICPWETSDAFALMDQPDQDPGEESKGAERTKPSSPVSEEISASPSTKWDEQHSRQSVCPWENVGAEEPNTEIAAKIPDLPKVVLKTSSSIESKKADVCPWEVENIEIGSKAEICPWEVTLAPSERISIHDVGGASKRKADTVATSPEMASSPRESICPWEVMDTRDTRASEPGVKSPDQSKVACKESSSTDSFMAEVCPWESQEADSSTKANVAPWEEPESLLGKTSSSKSGRALERARTTPPKEIEPLKAMGKASSLRESVCPWESTDPSEVFIKPEVSKAPSKKSESVESLRAEICPWEVTESPPDQSALSISGQDTTPKPTKKLSSPREEVCPWESMEVEESSRSGGQSPASRKSDSTESLRAVVCPWETSEDDLSTVDVRPWTAEKAPFEKEKVRHDPVETSKGKTDKAQRSPGAKKAGGGIAFKKIEKSKSHQETVCAWGSMDFEKPLAKSTRSLDLLLVGYKKYDSNESLKAEVCPWEFQEIHTRAEICPWEVYEGSPESDTLMKDKGRSSTDETSTRPVGWWKTTERAGNSQESISPWDSIELLSSRRSPDRSKAGSSKSDSVESLRAEVCPWEVEEEEPDSKVSPSKIEPALITKVVLKQDKSRALKGKRLSISPDWKNTGGPSTPRKIEKAHSHHELAHKSTEELSIKQSSKSFDLSKAGPAKSDSAESLRAEVCPWESQEFELITKTEEFPWEPADLPLEKRLSRKVVSRTPLGDTKRARKDPGDTTKVVPSSCSASGLIKQPDSSESRKTGDCLGEAESPEASVKEEICPWETGTELVIETEKQATRTDKTSVPPAGEETPPGKPESLARHRPLCRTYPERTLTRSKGGGPGATAAAKTGSDSAMANVRPWDDEPATVREDSVAISKAFSEASLWGVGGRGCTLARGQKRQKTHAWEVKRPRQAKSVSCLWDSD